MVKIMVFEYEMGNYSNSQHRVDEVESFEDFLKQEEELMKEVYVIEKSINRERKTLVVQAMTKSFGFGRAIMHIAQQID